MRLLYSLIPALALLSSHSAIAQGSYPDRPIKMIVPLAAASAVDVAARIVSQKMADNMGQQFVILNQPGASGLIGAEAVARAEPDGYTIGGFNDSIMTMVSNLQSKMRWDILKDFEPVSLVATVEWGLIVNNQASFKSAADLIAAAKAAPGKIDYGSGGPGSPQHLAMAMFASAELPRTAKPSSSSLRRTSGSPTAFSTSAFRRAMMSFGVPAGARIANHELKKKPGRPDSETVGTSGNCDSRFSVVTPINLSCPPRTSAATVPRPWKATGIWPAATSVAAWVAPL